MGMSAYARIWVGYKLQEDNEFGEYAAPKPLLFLLDDDGYDFLYGDKLTELMGGLKLKHFYEGGERVGFGCEVYWTWWGKVNKIDFGQLKEKADQLKMQLQEFFDKHGVDLPIDVYISVDYS